MLVVNEEYFRNAIYWVLEECPPVRMVTGPGRSGAIASVYASHILKIPFLPYGQACPKHMRPLLIIDTAKNSGATLRKAMRKYDDGVVFVMAVYYEPPRLKFWYEI